MLYIFTINVFFYTYQVHMILFYSVQTIGLTIVDKIEDMHQTYITLCDFNQQVTLKYDI
jgi:hypothetical protein